MLSLPSESPEVYAEFVKQGFAIQPFKKSFPRIKADKIVEITLNKDKKTPGNQYMLQSSTSNFLTGTFHKLPASQVPSPLFKSKVY